MEVFHYFQLETGWYQSRTTGPVSVDKVAGKFDISISAVFLCTISEHSTHCFPTQFCFAFYTFYPHRSLLVTVKCYPLTPLLVSFSIPLIYIHPYLSIQFDHQGNITKQSLLKFHALHVFCFGQFVVAD